MPGRHWLEEASTACHAAQAWQRYVAGCLAWRGVLARTQDSEWRRPANKRPRRAHAWSQEGLHSFLLLLYLLYYLCSCTMATPEGCWGLLFLILAIVDLACVAVGRLHRLVGS